MIALVNRLTAVAAAVGPKRVVTELIPLVAQPSFYQVENDEVLSAIGRQLLALFDIAGGPATAADTLPPLMPVFESLLAEEEVIVRQSAVTCLTAIVATLSPDDVANLVLPTFKRVVLNDWFAARVSGASVAPALLAALPESQLATIRGVFASLMADETPMVRRAAALALPAWTHALAQATARMPPQARFSHIRADIYPFVRALSVEDHDSLRVLAPPALAALIARMRPADFPPVALALVEGLQDDYSWRVRQALALSMAQICEATVTLGIAQNAPATPAPAGAPAPAPHADTGVHLRKILAVYGKLFKDKAADVRAAAASVAADVAKACVGVPFTPVTKRTKRDPALDLSPLPLPAPLPAATNPHSGGAVETILAALDELVTDASVDVKLDLCSSLLALAPLVSKDSVMKTLVPVFQQLCRDDAVEVRNAVIEGLEIINEVVGPQGLTSALLPLFLDLAKDTKWRIRMAVVGKLGFLARILGVKVFEKRVHAILLLALSDHVHSIRQRTCEQLGSVTQHLGIKWVVERLLPPALALYDKTQNYLHRMTSLLFVLNTVAAADNACPADVIERHMLQVVLAGATDDVANVRVAAARCCIEMAPRLDAKLVQAKIKPLMAKNANDADRDVAYFSGLALKLC